MKLKLNSLYQQYLIIIISIFILVTTTVTTITFLEYKLYNEHKLQEYRLEADKVNNILKSNFVNIEYFFQFIGQKIAQEPSPTSNQIADIFLKYIDVARFSKHILSIPFYDFVAPNGKVIATPTEGVIAETIIMPENSRSWMKLAPKHPWKLIFSPPTQTIVSSNYQSHFSILIGYGITDKQNNFLGTISTGIPLDKLYSATNQSIEEPTISILLLSQDFKILTSTGVKDNIQDLLSKQLTAAKIKEGILNQNINYNHIRYSYYKILDNYPFIILIGQPINILKNELNTKFAPYITQLIFITIIFLLLFYLFKVRLINPILAYSKNTQLAGKDYYNEIHDNGYPTELALIFNNLKNGEIAIKELKETRNLLDHNKQQLEYLTASTEDNILARTHTIQNNLQALTHTIDIIKDEILGPLQRTAFETGKILAQWQESDEDSKIRSFVSIVRSSKNISYLLENLLGLPSSSTCNIELNIIYSDLIVLLTRIIKEFQKNLHLNKNIHFELAYNNISQADCMLDPLLISHIIRVFLKKLSETPEGKIIINIQQAKITYNHHSIAEGWYCGFSHQGLLLSDLSFFKEIITNLSEYSTQDEWHMNLYFCRAIINAHNGEIYSYNYYDTNTTELGFLIPANQSDFLSEQSITNYEIYNKSSGHLSTKKYKILMIDDEESCLVTMSLFLRNTEFELYTVQSGIDALNFLQENYQDISLIFLDLMMPDMYGLNVLTAFMANSKFSAIPVVLQTGLFDETEIQKGFDLGIKGCIKKPYNKEQILTLLRKFCCIH